MDFSIITVNYNLKEDTVRLIQSLLEAGAALEQIVVVDNHSENDSVAFIKKAFPEKLTVLCTAENKGYAYGLNTGIEYCLKQNAANWLLLINNDTIVADNYLAVFEQETDKQQYDMLGPVIYYMDAPEQIWGLGDVVIPGTMIAYRRYTKTAQIPPEKASIRVDFLNGCAMLVHRSVFERIGLFDTTFFMYAEEVDFCWRARQVGIKMAVVPGAKMWHKVSASANVVREQSLFLRIHNQIKFYKRYAAGLQKWIMFLFSTLRNFSAFLKFLLAGKPGLAFTTLKGWRAGWFE
jgi:GT2 family glycosyltransferase